MLHRLFARALIVIVPVIVLLMSASSAFALGIGVAPGKMDFSVRPGSSEAQTLNVINQSDRESVFRVYIEGEQAEWVKIEPGEFTLDAQDTESVEILVAPPLTAAPEEHNFPICIVSIPPNSALNIGAGIKVSTHVQITELPVMAIQWWIVAVVILMIVAAGLLVFRWRKARHA
jgi:P pilus assembly chaperone PapD